MPTQILHLTLHRRWFLKILLGEKKTEFRDITEFWRKRLEGRAYEAIKFRNGYNRDAPTMLVEFRQLDIDHSESGAICYALRLGDILSTNPEAEALRERGQLITEALAK